MCQTSFTSSMVKFEWHSPHQQAFDKIKKVIETEIQVLLCYPDFNEAVLFHLYTDVSDHQLGAVIMQDKKPITSENNIISNFKLSIPIYTALIFKEQAKVKDIGLRDKRSNQPH
jgi:hypothetical protein